MPDKRLIDRDPARGVTNWFHEEADGTFVVETVQDITSILEMNQWARNRDHGRWGEMEHVASVPLQLHHQLQKEGILDDQTYYAKWLNRKENEVFRTRPGRV